MLVWNIRLKSKHFNIVAFVVLQPTVVNNTHRHTHTDHAHPLKIPMKIKSIKLIKWFGHYFLFHSSFFLFSIKLCCGRHNCGAAKILPGLVINQKRKLWKNHNYKISIIDHHGFRIVSILSISVNIMKFWSEYQSCFCFCFFGVAWHRLDN